ncbi:hypothetical protein GCM10011613_32000 [Cellvibrio zantedeschiae]|uniref:Lipoprotein n=1 Tax=Cellvibrio zantedeschiae TaxID=1237077 RepID=A0ABQ3B9D3_9GAMM|nr:hypothetical protein [Cellvibrio zantedeschiae]GGY84619.1 hypothetical protein GCM10011613_32000 [Cellvibrio zantedeschiae]
MKIVTLTSLLSLLALTACSSAYTSITQNETSGLIGCHPKEIAIEPHDFSGQTWTATCKNTKFYCSKTDKLVNCKEAK